MTAHAYQRGQEVLLTDTVTVTATGAAAAPASATLDVIDPSGTQTTYTSDDGQVTIAGNRLSMALMATLEGTYQYRFVVPSGSGVGAGWSSFRVTHDAFSP